MGGKGSGGKNLSPCGTVARYQRHRKAGEDCPLCREAMRVFMAGKYKPRPPRTAPTRHDKKKLILEAKFQRGACAHCNLEITLENWMVFEWDHIDPTIKSFQLSNSRAHSVTEILEELEKCQMLCSNCHQKHTYNEGHYFGRIKRQNKTELNNLYAFGLGDT